MRKNKYYILINKSKTPLICEIYLKIPINNLLG